MQQQHDAAAHSTPGLETYSSLGTIRATAPWSVISLEALPAYRLHVSFHDGLSGTVSMSRLIHAPDAGVFTSLRDESLFAQAGIEFGAVTWPNEPDLAPDAMHKAIAATGEWTP